MYLSSIEFPTASHKCEKTKNVIELACLSHTMKTGADPENSEIGVQNTCQLYIQTLHLFIFEKNFFQILHNFTDGKVGSAFSLDHA